MTTNLGGSVRHPGTNGSGLPCAQADADEQGAPVIECATKERLAVVLTVHVCEVDEYRPVSGDGEAGGVDARAHRPEYDQGGRASDGPSGLRGLLQGHGQPTAPLGGIAENVLLANSGSLRIRCVRRISHENPRAEAVHAGGVLVAAV